ncbi:hypothetical protein B0H14DRAFT_2741342, partial [Mycena olivaceomarginata]
PAEITEKIFTICLPTLSPESNSIPCPSSRTAPLLLAQVCRQWRDFSISMPALWAFIFYVARSRELLELWLSRAGNLPLTIFLLTGDEPRARMFMDAVIPHCSRWKDVHLTLPLSAVRQLNMIPFPLLERLTISTIGNNMWTTGDPAVIRDAPLLRYADISLLPQVDLPFEQLTTLRAGNTGVDQTIAILQRCPNLVDLSCSYAGAGNQSTTRPPVELRSLRSLTAVDKRFLPFLTVPHLERFDISGDIEAGDLQSLISRSSCDLRVLCVQVYRTPAPHLKPLLRVAASVVHLQLQGEGIESQMEIFQDANVLPNLEQLEIRDPTRIIVQTIMMHTGTVRYRDAAVRSDNHYRALADMLWWRQARGLQSFQLSLGPAAPFPPAHAITAFRALAQVGLQVRVTQKEAVLLDTRAA